MNTATVNETGSRRRVRVTGAVRQVRTTARGGRPALRAELGAGDDDITVVWLGRTRIPGVEPGRQLAVEGRLSTRHGRPVMYNPRYDLSLDPAGATP